MLDSNSTEPCSDSKRLKGGPVPHPGETTAMGSPHSPKQNHLLAALPAEEYTRLLPHLELMPMPLGWAVYESGGQLSYLYFPTTSIVSLLYVMENGSSAEIAVSGNEGQRKSQQRPLMGHAGKGRRTNSGISNGICR
jgi:hypothetical protein